MDLKNIIVLGSAVINLLLGIFVFSKGRTKIVNIVYGLIAFSVAYWSFAMVLYRAVETVESSIFWCKILYTAPIFIVSSFLYFSYIFPEGKKAINKFVLPSILVLFGFMIYLGGFTDTIISNVIFVPEQEKIIVWGTLYWLYLLFIPSLFIWSFINLLIKREKTSGIFRVQITYVFLGTFLASGLGMVTNLILPTFGNFYFNWIGQVFSLIMVIFIAYAIVVHRLMDIKMVMRRYSVFLVSISTVLVLATAVKYLADTYFYDYTSWADPLILVAALFIFPPIRNRFYKLANEYFFSSLYDSGEVIASLSDKLRSTLETERIYDFIYQTLTNAFHVKAFGLLIYNEADKNYLAEYNNGFALNKRKIFPEDKTLNQMFIKKNQPVITEDAGHTPELNGNQNIELLKKLGVEILAPLNVKNKTIGLIALGKKESGDMYNDEDLKVLEVAGAQTAIALENALLYKETKNFSLKLEKEVEKATRDLKKANLQLKKLDAAKSEFISIASHQLRTPLTVIKGYISMMLEHNFGELTKPEEESLSKVYESNERLIQLVEDLLNISRIESGRLQFNYRDTDLNKMAESVVDELSGNAKKKNLILEYKAPAKPLPTLKLDDEKVRQVVMNLIDNAIKYTKQGKVAVTLEQAGNKINFCVADSGMGIKPEDMPNLFKKFSRGTGTSLIHTEGTGLGLYVARMMIEAHKGRVWAESDGVGKGSKFCFELPVK